MMRRHPQALYYFLAICAMVVAHVGAVRSYAASNADAGIAVGTVLNIAMVPSLEAEPFYYAKSMGYYRNAGLEVHLSSASNAGAALLTGVVNGTYDASATAWFPVAIASSRGMPIKMIMAASSVDKGSGRGISGVVVKRGSPVEGYKDLQGRTVAINALTSLFALVTKIDVKQAGGDPDKVRFVALPFKSGVQAVVRGQADAAVVVSPFQTIAAENGSSVLSGDPIQDAMPQGAVDSVLVTSTANWKRKAKAFAAFKDATFKAARALNASAELRQEVAEKFFGLGAGIAKRVPMPAFAVGPIDANGLQQQLDLAQQYGYLARPLKATQLLFPQS